MTKTTAFFTLLAVMLITARFTKAQIPTFSLIDTSIVCTIGGYSDASAFGDFNNDGLEDLIIDNACQTSGPCSHFLFLNEGNWNFIPVNEGDIVNYISEYGSHGSCWGDYNNDGNLDLFIASIINENNLLFMNNGDGSFTKINEGALVNDGGDSGPPIWVDIDNDGYLDLYVVNQEIQKNFLYHNNGDGTFTKITEGEIVNFVFTLDLFATTWVDIDNDRDMDMFHTAKEYSQSVGYKRLFINDGNGNFTSDTSRYWLNDPTTTWSACWGDYDNDGYMDLFAPTISTGGTADYDLLYHNKRDGTFEKIEGVVPVNQQTINWGAQWADLDNDGYLDLFTNENDKNYYIRNNGDGTFTKTETDIGGSIVDMNNDGFLDMFQVRGYDNSPPYENLIYCNDGNFNSWITIKLIGTVSNKSAIGARVIVKATIGGSPVWQMGDIGMSWKGLNAHFGFGHATLIDSLIIRWPAGHDTLLTNVAVNQVLTIIEEIPSGYLRASFAIDTTIGRGELTVQFKDISRFDPAYPITSWSWDFNGDGNEDSDEQNPIFVYSNNEGEVYDVSLTISNGADTATMTKKECIRIYPSSSTENLARWGTATSSSSERHVFLAQYAIDGELLTRWGSEHTESTSWLKVELDSVYEIGKVIIHWEPAYARKYEIQTSLDDLKWNRVYCENAGNGLEDTIYFTGTSAKYVKIDCQQKISVGGSYYGYSVYEIEIYRSDGNVYDDNCGTGIIELTKPDNTVSVYPNPFNESVTFSFMLEKSADVQLSINDLLGRKIANLYNGRLEAGQQQIVWERTNIHGKRVKPGYYVYDLTVSDRSDNLKLNGKLLIAD